MANGKRGGEREGKVLMMLRLVVFVLIAVRMLMEAAGMCREVAKERRGGRKISGGSRRSTLRFVFNFLSASLYE